MLCVKEINKIYRVKNIEVYANQNITFTVNKKEMLWISGSTGSGKTTLMNVLSAIDIADSGNILWDENNISKMTDSQRAEFRLKYMGLTFQSLELMKSQDAYNNVALPLRYSGMSENNIKKCVEETFEYLDITFLLKKMPMHMSGGQQQRVALARALINKPRYILGDEVSSALDTDTAVFIYGKIREFVKENESIGILISHDASIEKYVDRHMVMKDGNIWEVK